jgi:prepilin-type N-terminal cleavage/methylation domain-containing protein
MSRSRAGFTLTELLVVLGVNTALAGLLVFTVQRVRAEVARTHAAADTHLQEAGSPPSASPTTPGRGREPGPAFVVRPGPAGEAAGTDTLLPGPPFDLAPRARSLVRADGR